MKITHAPAPSASLLPLQQHPAYARALRAGGRCVEELCLTSGTASGSALALRRSFAGFPVSLVSRGPILDRGAEQADAIGSVRGHLRGAVIFSPDHPPAMRGLVPLMTAAHVAEWRLHSNAADLRAALRVKWRNRLTRAEAEDTEVRVSPMPADPSHWLFAREAALRRRRKYRALPAWLAVAYAATSPDLAWLFEARKNGETVAGMLFLRHGGAATYHMGWSGDEGRRVSAHTLLLWRAATFFAQRGVERIDLGTVDTESSPGLARFKLGTGAKLRPLGGTWLAPPWLQAC
ncbi:Acetyltransferase (GNAT) domain-containing protein [Poseidonocella pacifica]|uniref:Acetyltransferase (GNAT) domain-containing protein n=1 Tax=Poseidonocella pacifica TaxID=871651 RepID=A0A1I0VPU5_9RHOB|nr:GNAT family N-acetyltransferase [Poseidonocella pacifica]SFA77910.1 Acetyltransferase (GNAT) domain-containing protein [Poseidonocella pacifica]